MVNERGETVALDLELTPELMHADRAREVIRTIQEVRKSTGFDVSNRILPCLAARAGLLEAIREHVDLIADEVLAVNLRQSNVKDPATEEPELSLRVKIIKVWGPPGAGLIVWPPMTSTRVVCSLCPDSIDFVLSEVD